MLGKTATGFEFEINDKLKGDYELIEWFAMMDEGNLAVLPKAVNKLLGKEQANKLKEHLRDEDGIVPSDKLMDEVAEILNASKPLKNS